MDGTTPDSHLFSIRIKQHPCHVFWIRAALDGTNSDFILSSSLLLSILLRFSGVFSISVAHLSRSNTSKQHLRRFLLRLFSFLSVSVAQYLPLLFRGRLLSPDNATYLRVFLNFRSNFPKPHFCQHPFFCFRATEFPKGSCLRSNLSCKGQFRTLSSEDCAPPFLTFRFYRSISAEAFLFAQQ